MNGSQNILVWDIPTRLFHWLLAGSFAVAYLTAEAEGWENVHFTAGFTLLGLIAFRLAWGFIGSRYVRFSAFSYGPAELMAYLRSLLSSPRHYTGHNPLGSLGIFALLGLGLLAALSGWLLYLSGSEWLEEPHELFANLMLAVVAVHIAGVFISSRLHGENLARAMVTGQKQGYPEEAISKASTVPGALLLAAVIGFWVYAWQHPFDTGRLEQKERAGQMESGEQGGKDDDGDND